MAEWQAAHVARHGAGRTPTSSTGVIVSTPPNDGSEVSTQDIERLGTLAALDTTGIAAAMQTDLAHIMTMIDHLRARDTTGVEPLHSPLQAGQPLRPDAVTEPSDREALLAAAPATTDGLFLVPRVVE